MADKEGTLYERLSDRIERLEQVVFSDRNRLATLPNEDIERLLADGRASLPADFRDGTCGAGEICF